MRQLLLLGSVCCMSAGVAIVTAGSVTASSDAAVPGSPEFYKTRVTDILEDNCLSCHDDTAKGGLRLDSYAAIRKGGDDGAVIVPGDPDASMLIQAIRRTGDLKMPPKHPLKDAEIADLVAWVKAGAVGSDAAPPDGAGKPGEQSATSPLPSAGPATANAAAAEPAKTGPKADDVAVMNPGKAVAQPNVATEAGFVPTASLSHDADFFENKVRPILANSCYDCHSDSPESGLRLDTKGGFDHGGKRGALIVS